MRRLAVPRAGEEVEQLELLHVAEGSVCWYNHFGKLFGSINISIHILHNPAIPFLGDKNKCISQFLVWNVRSLEVITLS